MLNVDDLQTLLNRAKHAKHPHEMVHTVARLVQAGDEQVSLDRFDEETRSFWNYFRTASFVQLGKITGPDPHTQIKPDQDYPTTKALQNSALWFQRKVAALDKTYGYEDILAAAEADNINTGTGFIYVKDDGSCEHISGFDIYTDNVKSTPNDIPAGRYLFIRRTMDEKELLALLEEEDLYDVDDEGNFKNLRLTDDGVEYDSENKPHIQNVGNLPGREVAGTNIDNRWELREFETSTYRETSNFAIEDTQKYVTSDLDGLVEVWECWYTDDESPSGWVKVKMYDDHLLGEPYYLPAGFDGPPLFAFAYNRISNQFWQDGMFIEVEKTQLAVNDMTNRILYILGMMEYPPLMVHQLDEDQEYTFTPGETITYMDGKNLPKFMEMPQPPLVYLAIRRELQKDARDNIGIHEVSEGKKPKGITAGVALEKLSQEANTRISPLLQNRDTTLRKITRRRVMNILYNEQMIAKSKADEYNQGERVQVDENRASVNPEKVADDPTPERNFTEYMPAALKEVTFEEVSEGFAYNFRITPRIERPERIENFLAAFDRGMAIAEGIIPDPIATKHLAIDLASAMSDQRDIGDEFQTIIDDHLEDFIETLQGQVDKDKEAADEAVINAEEPSQAVEIPEGSEAEALKAGGKPVVTSSERTLASGKSYQARRKKQVERKTRSSK